jgi:hypothetical protein
MCNQKVLLLNASNLDGFPVYPYAFIQVPAVARLSGIKVICKDLLGIPQGKWSTTIQDLLNCNDPDMILITLRNTDSLSAQNYEQNESNSGSANAYFPIERAKNLIAVIRNISDLQIAVGGFGFSVMPEEIMHYLRPNFGVFGDPDGFFENFDNILAGELTQVPNLLYFQGDRLSSNPRKLYPPLANPEYTPQVIDEMMAFYKTFPSPGFQGAPIEIMRGCIFSCVFCSEPLVKGKLVRYRDLSVILEEIQILVDHGITEMYMITSELNPEGNAFVLELADRIYAFNQQQPDARKVTWFGANYLLNFSSEDFNRLYQSGFTGGWFDITALDDENAISMRTPYRNKYLLSHLKTYAYFKRQQALQNAKEQASKDDISIGWTMFLGNPATTTMTIRNTLQIANQNGIAKLFDSCGVIAPIRVFDYEEPEEATLDVTYSITPDLKRKGYQQILPSFAYPPALLQDFGSEQEISQLFKYIADTYLSKKYQDTRNWHSFMRQNTTADWIRCWSAELSETYGIQVIQVIKESRHYKLDDLFSDEEPNDEETSSNYENLAKQVFASLLSACIEIFASQFDALGFPASKKKIEQATPYELATAIFNKWPSEDALFEALNDLTSSVQSKPLQELCRFCVQGMMYKFNILFTQKYKALFVSDGPAQSI